MKNWASKKGSFWLLLVAGVFLVGLTGTPLQAEEVQAVIGVTLQVGGMHCEHCIDKVKEALLGAGATRAEVSLEKNEAVVQYSQEKTDPEKLVAAVKQAGYEATVKP